MTCRLFVTPDDQTVIFASHRQRLRVTVNGLWACVNRLQTHELCGRTFADFTTEVDHKESPWAWRGASTGPAGYAAVYRSIRAGRGKLRVTGDADDTDDTDTDDTGDPNQPNPCRTGHLFIPYARSMKDLPVNFRIRNYRGFHDVDLIKGVLTPACIIHSQSAPEIPGVVTHGCGERFHKCCFDTVVDDPYQDIYCGQCRRCPPLVDKYSPPVETMLPFSG